MRRERRRLVLLVLVTLACANRSRSTRVEYVAGVGDCPQGQLSNGCREREWPELSTHPELVRQRLHERCSFEGHGSSCIELGLLLSRWRNLPHDEEAALHAFLSGCDQHYPDGCTFAALMLEAGRGRARDPGRALELHARACFAGVHESCLEEARLQQLRARPGELEGKSCVTCGPGLEDDEVGRALARARGAMRYCVMLEWEHGPVDEAMTFDFAIDAEGTVRDVAVRGTLNDALSTCMSDALQTERFPRPRSVASVKVSFPWHVVRGARGVDGTDGRSDGGERELKVFF